MPYEFGSVSSGIINSLLSIRSADHYSTQIMVLEEHRAQHSYTPALILFPERYSLIIISFYFLQVEIFNYSLQGFMAEYIVVYPSSYIPVYDYHWNTVQIFSVFFKFSGLEFLKRRMMIPYYN